MLASAFVVIEMAGGHTRCGRVKRNHATQSSPRATQCGGIDSNRPVAYKRLGMQYVIIAYDVITGGSLIQ